MLQVLDWKIKLNPESEVLECTNKLGLLNCIVPLSHFDYEQDGYYNLHYTNSRGDLSIYYEVTPFKVLLPERKVIKLKIQRDDNLNTILVGETGTIYFFTNYNDSENIFNISDIEENTKFETTVIDDSKNKYDVKCRLFEPTNKKIVILCNLDENLKNKNSYITLSSVKLNYGEY